MVYDSATARLAGQLAVVSASYNAIHLLGVQYKSYGAMSMLVKYNIQNLYMCNKAFGTFLL